MTGRQNQANGLFHPRLAQAIEVVLQIGRVFPGDLRLGGLDRDARHRAQQFLQGGAGLGQLAELAVTCREQSERGRIAGAFFERLPRSFDRFFVSRGRVVRVATHEKISIFEGVARAQTQRLVEMRDPLVDLA